MLKTPGSGILERVREKSFCDDADCVEVAMWTLRTEVSAVKYCSAHTVGAMKDVKIWANLR